MTIEQQIKNSMARFIERTQGRADVTVTDWEEEFDRETYYGCETCGPEYEDTYLVFIRYTIPEQSYSNSFTYVGKFTDLIKELDNE